MGRRERREELLSNLGKEAGVLSGHAVAAARKSMLIGLGLAALAAEETGALVSRMEDRGEAAGIEIRERIDQALDQSRTKS